MKPFIVYEYKKPNLWHGFVSVRSYIVDKAKKEQRDLKILWKKEYVVIPHEKLDEGFHNKEEFESIHYSPNMQKYHLVDFDWKTYKPKEEETQIKLI